VSRGGLSILSNLGLTELIAKDEADYVAIAKKLAGNLPRVAEMRAGMRNRLMTSPLTDGQKFARSFETAFRQIWQTWCAGRK
jgi:predicted O-linked N-acetylglucosamine transferase (SPINDLY family)